MKQKPKELDKRVINQIPVKTITDYKGLATTSVSKPKELDWVIKYNELFDNTQLMFLRNRIEGFIKQTLTQQRTELLEEIKREAKKCLIYAGVGMNEYVSYEEFKKFIDLLNKKDE